ncbi:MAG: PilZ domain-containing protein, partial [Candidatus Omnitrophica bacterium]|nr:PilZ domain-containing protein [Candidatus Omnitrophota bacterium]
MSDAPRKVREIMKEERISQRVEIEMPAKFCFEEQPKSWFEATIVNISTHGFCFRAEAAHNGTLSGKPVIRLFIELPDEENMELDIQIAWSGKTSSYNCLAGGEILDPSGSDYQKVLEPYTKLFRAQSEKKII